MARGLSRLFSFSHFSVFFLLLLALLISVWFARYLPLEGFISYQQNVTGLSSVTVPPYTTTRNIIKLYDSVYYDSQTGAVLELFGKGGDTATTDTTGASLTNMVLMPRDTPTVVEYDVVPGNTFRQNVVEPHYIQSPLSSVNLSWIFPLPGSVSTLPYNYQVAYFAWKTETVIFIYDIVQEKLVGVLPFLLNSSSKLITTGLAFNNTYVADADPHNGSYINVMPQYTAHLSGYSAGSAAAAPVTQLYQIAANIWFDTANGVLVVGKPGLSDVVVETGASFTLNKASNTVSTCYFTMDEVGHNVIMTVPMSNKRTMVCVMYKEVPVMGCTEAGKCNNNNGLAIRKVVRFDPSLPGGVDGETKQGASTPGPMAPVTTPGPDRNEYILKTQIVPPVCPACPSCTCNGGATPCASCQTGGSGSGNNSLASLIASSYTVNQGPGWGNGNGGYGGYGYGGQGPISSTLIGAENTVGDVVDTAVAGTTLLGLGAIGGVNQLASDILAVPKAVVPAVVGDVAGVANKAIGGAESIVNNTVDDLTGQKGRVGGSDRGGPVKGGAEPAPAAQEESTVDNEPEEEEEPTPSGPKRARAACDDKAIPGAYGMAPGPGLNNYYGALAGRPSSNFMPVTADFSKFGR